MAEKRAKKIGVGIAALFVGTAIGAGVSDSIKEMTKTALAWAKATAQEKIDQVFPVPLPQIDKNAVLSILIARLDGDSDGTQTNHVAAALRRAFDQTNPTQRVEVQTTPRILREGTSGNVFHDHQAGERTGGDWLRESGAHILIWGDVLDRNRALRLFFVLSEGETIRRVSESYKLSEVLELSKDFDQDVGLIIAARAMTLAAPAYNAGKFVADSLDALYRQLRMLSEQRLIRETKAICELQLVTADTAQVLGEQTGLNARLHEAIDAYREIISRELCNTDQDIRYRARNNFGNALTILGAREEETVRLHEAVAAYRLALKDARRDRMPLDWAGTQNNLGGALCLIGARDSSAEILEQSIAAFRAGLEERTRERVPLQWAMTQNNLGTALARLGEVKNDIALLQTAIEAYRSALNEWTRKRVPLRWAMTQDNVGSVLVALGERETGTARLEEAVEAYRSALEERTRYRVPLEWATTQNNLGSALWTLGDREANSERVEAAIHAFRSALDVFEDAGAGYYAGIARRNLSDAEAALAERRKDTN